MHELIHVRSALLSAAAMPDDGFTEVQMHRNRSRNFVEALANAFRLDSKKQPNIRVLSRHTDAHRSEFGLNELLYDVLVCEVAQTKSPRHSRPLTFVRRAIWQIESEFAADAREALFDFNKLILGNAPYKLFVGPKTDNDAKFIEALFPSAQSCSGQVFIALLPHPSQWHLPLNAAFWRASGERWVPVQVSSANAANPAYVDSPTSSRN